MDTGNLLCVSELLSSLCGSIKGHPRGARSRCYSGFILPIAWCRRLIAVEMRKENESSQVVAAAGGAGCGYPSVVAPCSACRSLGKSVLLFLRKFSGRATR